jgi:hypothetical protein
MFEKAARLKLRFETQKGPLSVEDLWDLPLSGNGLNLDKIAMALSRQLKEESTESFVLKTSRSTDVLQLKFDIAKHIIDVRLAEIEAAKVKAEVRAKKDRILSIIERKQDEQLEGQPLEDLLKMVESL